MARSKQTEIEDDDDGDYDEPAPARRPRRWLRRLVLFLVLLGVAFWFLPALVAHTPLRNWLVSAAVPGLGGRVTIGSASLGWLSPVVVQQIVVRDAQNGEPITIAAVKTETSLWRLALSHTDLGVIHVEHPEVKLALRPDGSNVEDLLQPLLDAAAKKTASDTANATPGPAL